MDSEWNRWIWATLQIEPTDDERTIRRGYAKRLKAVRPEDDSEGFQQLRQAYERALALAEYMHGQADEQDGADAIQLLIPAEALFVEQDGVLSPFAEEGEFLVSLEKPGMAAEAEPGPVVEQHDPVPDYSYRHPAPMSFSTAKPLRQADQFEDLSGLIEDLGNPDEEAERLWNAYLATLAKNSPTADIDSFMRDKAFQNFDIHDAFELRAAYYCADINAVPAVRGALVHYFKWEEDLQHIYRLAPHVAESIIERFRSDRTYHQLQARAAGGGVEAEAANTLLAQTHPRFSWKLLNRRFAKNLNEMIEQVRWQTPDLIGAHLNADVFSWWEARFKHPRMYLDIAIFVYFAAVPLWWFIAFSVINPTWRHPLKFGADDLIAIGIASVATAWFCTRGGDRNRIVKIGGLAVALLMIPLWWTAMTWTRVPWLDTVVPLFEFIAVEAICLSAVWLAVRYQFKVRIIKALSALTRNAFVRVGWIPAFLVLTTIALLDVSHDIVMLPVSAGLAVCTLAAFIGGIQHLSQRGWIWVAVLIAVFMVPVPVSDTLFPGYGFYTRFAILTSLAILVAQGGRLYYDLLHFDIRILLKLRIVWLAVASLLYWLAREMPGNAPMMAAGMWLAGLSGLLISDFYLSEMHPYLATILLAVTLLLPAFFVHGMSSFLIAKGWMMITIGMYICLNLIISKLRRTEFG